MNITPEKISKYEIRGILGSGSVGIVYLGYDPFVDRQVAIKTARADVLLENQQYQNQLNQFFNEARTAGRLLHPNIVSIYDAGIEKNLRYIVMEYIKGVTLKHYCDPKNLLPIDQVFDVIFKCCQVLNYAHKEGVIHRDIKPTNIMLREDNVTKIMDFSIALTVTDAQSTQDLGLMGTPAYMAPEQVQALPVTPQADIFSLGAVMYELLTGHPPFTGQNIHSIIYQITHSEPVPIKELRPEVPDLLVKIVEIALRKNAKERYKSGQEFYMTLSRAFTVLRHKQIELSDREKIASLKKLSFFTTFSDSEVLEILNASTWVPFEKKDIILNEGDIEQSFYILVEGRATVQKGERVLNILQAGDCFGEMGYVTQAQRTASIIADDPTVVLKVNATLIEQASLTCQLHFHKVFLKTLIERLSRSRESVAKAECSGS